MIKIWLEDYLTPSLNKLLRTHYRVRMREMEKLTNDLAYSYLLQNPDKALPNLLEEPTKKKVVITSYRKALLDPDNAIGGAKLLIDALVKLGFIFDDSDDMMQLVFIQEKSKDKKGTEIKISPL